MTYEAVHVFLPNQTISKSAMTCLVAVQIAMVAILWVFSPFVFLPTPGETAASFVSLWHGGLGIEMITSFTLNVQVIGWATVLSLLLAYATVLPFFRPVVEWIGKLRFLSPVGLTFFFTLASRDGHALKVNLLVFFVVVFFVTSMADVLNGIPRAQFDLARTLRMGEWRVVWEVVVLGQIDKVFEVLRQNAAIGWAMLTMVEGMSRSEGGVGAMLLNQNKHFHLSAVFAIQICILLVGLGQDYALGVLRSSLCPYADLSKGRK